MFARLIAFAALAVAVSAPAADDKGATTKVRSSSAACGFAGKAPAKPQAAEEKGT